MAENEKKSLRTKVETTKMSSRGQIVIPQYIRDRLKAYEGTVFAVIGTEDTLILKKLETPSSEILLNEIGKINLSENKKRGGK